MDIAGEHDAITDCFDVRQFQVERTGILGRAVQVQLLDHFHGAGDGRPNRRLRIGKQANRSVWRRQHAQPLLVYDIKCL